MNIVVLLLVSAIAQPSPASRDSVTICVDDARTRVPLVGAEITSLKAGSPSRRLSDACARLSVTRAGTTADSMLVVRSGYLPHRVAVPFATRPAGDTLRVSLLAVDATRAERLAAVQVTATRTAASTRDISTAGRTTVTLQTTDARTAGASTVNAVLSLMPFTNVRSARGETGLSLRGARREQVAITLDGMPLNDPATGIADVSDIPLAGLQSATVALGADPVGTGAGATGGVLALTSSAQRVASLRVGAFGQQTVEGAWHASSAGALWHASAAWRTATNDFGFINDAGVLPQREARVNNDEQRATLSLGVIGSRAQFSLLGSTSERGMVGPANVRAYDADRSHTDRLLARAQTTARSTTLSSGIRRMQLRYVDPTRPALNSRAVAWAADAEWRGAIRDITWRMGGGADRLTATGGITQRRSRGFGSVQRAWSALGDAGWSVDVGARADLIEGNGLLPTASIGAERRIVRIGERARLIAFGRAAQAVRVPTLYDLYFSSPQRLFVRALSPERVDLDVSSGLRVIAGGARRHASIEGTLVARNTRDAIVWFPGNFGWSPANVGVERLRGVESRAEVASGIASLSTWVTAYDAMLSTNGLHIPTPYVPRLAGGAQLQLNTAAQHATIVWRGMGARPYTAGPRNPDFELAAVSLVDITVAQQLRALPHWPWPRFDALVAFSLENAADASWQSVRGFPSPGRSWAISFTLQHSPR
ncbi:TonB-dependent receptor plug domain-containing protein [Gemmatimonas groenlandica]|uniref:TonB-dependent receptor plug domain-containing protein n=1 Tax=Gemmatimonas groenlandica TaxID=2732249 RepID=A0A6M4IP01_9BACT|nr:TonB-dependent receptor plug domain-containing protein [Gemmatimonas groenlandica]QJR35237.1 TonB-dependent receptor plug domain-containing protein [Gemmatimonas groenlandica]